MNRNYKKLAEINHEHIMDLMNEIGDLRRAVAKLQSTNDHKDINKENAILLDIEYTTNKLNLLKLAQHEIFSCNPIRASKYIESKREIEFYEGKLQKLKYLYEESKEEKQPMQVTEKALNFLRRSDDFNYLYCNGYTHNYFDGVPIEIRP